MIVHVRHQLVGDYDFRGPFARERERFDAVGGFDRLVADVPEQRCEELAIDRAIVNDEDRRHRRLRPGREGSA
jgi:hypothetical protein